jgi:hypothetical protein
MKFKIRETPFIPFAWMNLKLNEFEFINSKLSPEIDIFVKISKGKHYSLTIKRSEGGDIEDYLFEVRECLGDLISSFSMIPENLAHDDERFPLCIDETIVPFKKLYVSNQSFGITETDQKKRISVPSYFRVRTYKGEVKEFELKNAKYDRETKTLRFVNWFTAPKSLLSPRHATIDMNNQYQFAGIQHIIGDDKEFVISYHDNDGNPIQRTTCIKQASSPTYEDFMHTTMHFEVKSRVEFSLEKYNEMLGILHSISKMNPRYCTQQQAFDIFVSDWMTIFEISSYRYP